MKKPLCIALICACLSTSSAFAMSTSDFDAGMSKGINYYNRGLYYEAIDEFQWFCDANWGALNSGQQKYALDYLGGAKEKLQKYLEGEKQRKFYQSVAGSYVDEWAYQGTSSSGFFITISDINANGLTIDYFRFRHMPRFFGGNEYRCGFWFNRAKRQANGSYIAYGKFYGEPVTTGEYFEDSLYTVIWINNDSTIELQIYQNNEPYWTNEYHKLYKYQN